MLGGIKRELDNRRDRRQDQQARRASRGQTADVPHAKVIDVYTGLSTQQRRQLSLEGFMGLNAASIRQILGMGAREVDAVSVSLKSRLG
jgi:hypothetical protein